MTITGSSLVENPPVGCHIVFPYNDESRAMEVVASYAGAGLKAGDAVVLILTLEHSDKIEWLLDNRGYDLAALKASGQYLCLDAARTLSAFMADGMPDQKRFVALVQPVLRGARRFGRVRAYGEMVNLLFGSNHAAALRLEEYWNELIREEQICLLCTYAMSGKAELADDLCKTHSHYIV